MKDKSIVLPVVDREVGDWGSCTGHQGRGTKEGRAKLTGNCRPTVRHSGSAQSGNLVQGTRNHRSATAFFLLLRAFYAHKMG